MLPGEFVQRTPQDHDELQTVAYPSVGGSRDDTHIFPEMKFDPETKR